MVASLNSERCRDEFEVGSVSSSGAIILNALLGELPAHVL